MSALKNKTAKTDGADKTDQVGNADKENHRGRWLVGIFLGVFALLCVAGAVAAMLSQKPTDGQRFSYQTKTIKLDGKDYTMQVADTPAKQELGLGGRDNLAPRAGMLFVYPGAQPVDSMCFWMKDMRFSLDIVWLDAQKQIVQIKPSLSPATYPKDFCPPAPSQYVVEINAGRSRELGLKVGQKLEF